MGKLSELLDAVADMDPKPDTMFDDIRAAAQADTDELQAGFDAREAELITADTASKEAIAAHEATIQGLRSERYDILRGVASDNAGGGTNDDPNVNGQSSDIVEQSPENVSIDDIFTEREA